MEGVPTRALPSWVFLVHLCPRGADVCLMYFAGLRVSSGWSLRFLHKSQSSPVPSYKYTKEQIAWTWFIVRIDKNRNDLLGSIPNNPLMLANLKVEKLVISTFSHNSGSREVDIEYHFNQFSLFTFCFQPNSISIFQATEEFCKLIIILLLLVIMCQPKLLLPMRLCYLFINQSTIGMEK